MCYEIGMTVSVLEKHGTARRFRFRFRNPLLRPFIIMKGLMEESISGDLITKMQESAASDTKMIWPQESHRSQ